MTYFVKGYGFHENGSKNVFNIIFDLDEVCAKSFIKTVEKEANLSPYRRDKVIIIEEIVVLSQKP